MPIASAHAEHMLSLLIPLVSLQAAHCHCLLSHTPAACLPIFHIFFIEPSQQKVERSLAKTLIDLPFFTALVMLPQPALFLHTQPMLTPALPRHFTTCSAFSACLPQRATCSSCYMPSRRAFTSLPSRLTPSAHTDTSRRLPTRTFHASAFLQMPLILELFGRSWLFMPCRFSSAALA